MRVNLPVINQEHPFPSGETLVSTTDLKGRITYCNPAFIYLSGFTREELLGQPHNMIRHPDMPEEAFRDMWDTIRAGLPWSAVVKNRRKDGSHYWVMANVTPLLDGDKPIGYMSVRTEASREDIRKAEALYAVMRTEREQGRQIHRLQNGQLRIDTVAGRLRDRLRLDVQERITVISALLVVTSVLTGLTLGHMQAGLTSWPALAALGLMALLTYGGSAIINRLTVEPVRTLMRYANRMAAGDLTKPLDLDRGDLIGQLARALNQLNVNLRSIVRDARTEVQAMLTATAELATGNQDLSARTETQASNLQETAASMEQITEVVGRNTSAAQEVAELAEQTMTVTRRSSQVVDNVTQTMQDIEASSKRIHDIIQVIDSIAFQTSILALNAAVEAARAQDHGRGFAVVAAEVRALSQRTALAAKEIKQLITDSSEKVRAGGELTLAASRTMSEALTSVEKVTTLVAQLSAGSHDQLNSISQINAAVNQLDSITQQNAAAVEQIAAASMSMAGRAKVVAEAVQVFKLDHNDTRASADAVAMRKEMKERNS
jgi:aerotaxis receptor